MSDKRDMIPGAENPTMLSQLELTPLKKTAAGWPGIKASLQFILKDPGLMRGIKALNRMNQKQGFDCPSCAWPDPDDERSGIAEYCENGAKAVASEATLKKIGADFFSKHSISELAAKSDYELNNLGRIAEPMYLPKGATHYQPISWENAFEKIAHSLNHLSSPNEAIFYTSGRTSNEAAFLYQLFVRAFGTNNLPDCSNMCHESSGVALSESLGIGKGSVTLEDFYHAEVIMILGQNPGTNHPRMLTALQKAKASGARIISINPLPETGLMGFSNPQTLKGMLHLDTALTDVFLQVRINGDMALLQAISKLLIETDQQGSVIDHEFVRNKTEGFEEFRNHLRNQDLDMLCKSCGIDKNDIQQAVDLLKHKNKIIVCWAMGLTQHTQAVSTIKEIVNLLLLKGSIGKQGAGTCPVRGHSNVQGDRTMGIVERPSAALLNNIEKQFSFTPPSKHGFDTVEAIKAMHDKRSKIFIALGGNFLSATPDTQFTAAALQRCELTAQISTKLNRSHLVHGEEAFILPCLGRSDKDVQDGREQFVSCENSMGVVQASKGVLQPISDHMLSEPAIVCKLAKATLVNRKQIDWDRYLQHYDHIRDDIEKTIPGFDSYNEKVRRPGGFYLPNCNREGKFDTANGKAQFNIATFQPAVIKQGELLMMTIRSHDQFNTTIYGMDDRYRGIFKERRVFLMNQADINSFGLKERDVVDIISDADGIERIAHNFLVIAYPIPSSCAATYFPEANVLVPISSVAEKSNTPVSKAVVVKLRKVR